MSVFGEQRRMPVKIEAVPDRMKQAFIAGEDAREGTRDLFRRKLKSGELDNTVIELDLAETDKAKAEASVKDMCEKLLANTVIENYSIEIA